MLVKQAYSQNNNLRWAFTGPVQFRNKSLRQAWFLGHRITYFWFGKLIIGDWPLYGANMAISRRLWQELSDTTCRNTKIHEDMDLAWHIHKAGVPVQFLKHIQNSVLARHMLIKSFYYPLMMIRLGFTSHGRP
jgi:hypothetical protein